MNKLIEEAENLCKQIDKAQVHLINARLSNDEEGKKSAISEMETAVCDVSRLLKCFIERKDNIVDLSEVWHYKDQEPPEIGRYILADTPQCGILLMFTHTREFADMFGNYRYAYIDDLMPRK